MTIVTSSPIIDLSAKRHHRSIETRQKIIAASLVEFAAHGFDGTSTRTITARAGVPSAALPFHFAAKEDLWKAAAERAFGEFHTRFGTIMETTVHHPVRTKADTLLVELVVFFAQRPELYRFMANGSNTCARLDWLLHTHVRPMHEMFDSLLEELEADGVKLPTHREHLFHMFLGAATAPYALARDFELHEGISPFDPEAVSRHARALIDAFLPDLHR